MQDRRRRCAGTDDDVYLRVGRAGASRSTSASTTTSSAATATPTASRSTTPSGDGLSVGDITRVQIEKSRDGVAGGWKLRGVKLRVNGRTLYDSDAHRALARGRPPHVAAPGLHAQRSARARRSRAGSLGEDDVRLRRRRPRRHQPVRPPARRRSSATRRTVVPRQTDRGGSAYGGRLGDGDEATITYRIDTITPELIKVVQPPPPPPPGPKPDLIVTEFTLGSVTVKNQGLGAAGPLPGDHGRHDLSAVTSPSPASRRARPLRARSIPRSAVTGGRRSWTT